MSLDRVLGERQKQYGNPQPNFARIGRIWGAILNRDAVPAHEVALMMAALKIIRIANDPANEDSWIDLLGYIQHGQKIANES